MSALSSGYTVKQVAALTGILETTLRMWEHRYRVVEPERSPGGYRLYSDAHVERLRSMAALVADGVPASVAARSLTGSPGLDVDGQRASARGAARRATPDLVGAAASLNASNLSEVLDRALKFAPIETVLDKWLMPELERLGQAWASDEITVAQEHFASAGVARALGRAFDAISDDSTPDVLVGLPEGSRHELGLLAFAVCLRRQRGGVVYLGSDVPVADWESAARTIRPRAAVIGVPQCAKVSRAQDVVDKLNAASPPISVWVGGAFAPQVRRAQRLPDRLSVAAGEVATALRAGRHP